MANSKYEYVRQFERADNILPNTWIVIRIDGRGFHKLSAKYGFEKPNDQRALHLMNEAAKGVMREVQELVVAYGESDEYSFVFHPSTTLFERRESKLTTTITSTFTSYYTHLWPTYFPAMPLSPPLPSFDGRAIVYPSLENLRDYLSWRQVDCHINNTYNTTFWALVNRGGLSTTAAETELRGTFFKDKNEILFSRFGINYNNEPDIFKKGSVLFRDYPTPSSNFPTGADPEPSVANAPETAAESSDSPKAQAELQDEACRATRLSKRQQAKPRKLLARAELAVSHADIIKDTFWKEHPWILGGYVPQVQ